MKVYQALDDARADRRPSAVTVGTLDGVHLGHQALIDRTIQKGRSRDIQGVAVTWDRHPSETLRPDRAPPLLTTLDRKLELLDSTGLDATLVLAFDAELSSWSPEHFVRAVLADAVGARAVFVGSDWRFGHRAVGDVPMLTELGHAHGFEVEGTKLREVAGGAVSSSRVRQAVANGNMELARTLLGRPFDVDGGVTHGDGRGKALGVPTANVALDLRMAQPPRGVYAGRVRAGERWYPSAVNVGVNPTFGGDPATTPVRVEAYLLDFDGDLYGKTVRVEFWERLRDESKFASAAALVEQIERDVEATRRVLGDVIPARRM
jgi:riboflavin kinase / FMN adenylyltransferase